MAKIKTMTCTQCGSDNTAFHFCDDGGWMNKDFVSCNGEGPFELDDGKKVPLQKIKKVLDDSVGQWAEPMICECFGNCEDQCDVNVVMQDGVVHNNVTAKELLTILCRNIDTKFQIIEAEEDSTIEEICENNEIQYVKGRGYYQVTKNTKAKANKKIVIQNKSSEEIISGDDAKTTLGISITNDFEIMISHLVDYDVYIQSTSSNRVIKSGSNIVYHVGNKNFYTYVDTFPGTITSGKRLVIFGTDSEIEGNSLSCGCIINQTIYDTLEDDGSGCESYIIATTKDYDTVKSVCESFGYIENEKLANCGYN